MPLHVDHLHAIAYALPMLLLFAVLIRYDKYVHFLEAPPELTKGR
jgi:hypothetical protein